MDESYREWLSSIPGWTAAVGKEIDAIPQGEDAPAQICLSCGAAMAKGDAKCGVCGREYRPEELALLPGLDASLDDDAPFCPRCGAYLFADESECAICGTA